MGASNPRITKKEAALLKGAIRRVFVRSDLRREVLETLPIVAHHDATRPRVKNWSKCPHCKNVRARYEFVIDHVDPVVPVWSAQDKMSWDEIINRIWCDKSGLQPLCLECHNIKTKRERLLRQSYKNNKS